MACMHIWSAPEDMKSKLGAGTEEISQLLEDMGLNLQSMMASRFVRPFAEEVRKWEQRLSLVSECIEIWMLVQRKWMYLESIFMDSDDIRHQLPQVSQLQLGNLTRHHCLLIILMLHLHCLAAHAKACLPQTSLFSSPLSALGLWLSVYKSPKGACREC